MKAVGALPTEERVQKMSNIQWLWYYQNLIKDEDENEHLMKSRIDYLAFFVNPELHKSVTNITNGDIYNEYNNKINTPVKKGDVYVNDSFEEELRAALGDESLTVLPDSSSAGNANMSQDDFLRMAEQMQQLANDGSFNNEINNEINNNEITINEEDLDYFED